MAKNRKRPAKSAPAPARAPSAKTGSTQDSFPIVGIGASAGGLEAMTQLLRPLPPNSGSALVLAEEPKVPTEEKALMDILSVLRQRSGVDFANFKHATLRRRIQQRMALHKVETLKDYATYVRQHPSEVKEPKTEGRPKAESRRPKSREWRREKTPAGASRLPGLFALRISSFGLPSDFGFRPSDF